MRDGGGFVCVWFRQSLNGVSASPIAMRLSQRGARAHRSLIRSAGARQAKTADREADRSKVNDYDDDDDDDDDVMMMMQARALQSDRIANLSMLGSIAARARSRRAGALNLPRNGRLKGTLN